MIALKVIHTYIQYQYLIIIDFSKEFIFFQPIKEYCRHYSKSRSTDKHPQVNMLNTMHVLFLEKTKGAGLYLINTLRKSSYSQVFNTELCSLES